MTQGITVYKEKNTNLFEGADKSNLELMVLLKFLTDYDIRVDEFIDLFDERKGPSNNSFTDFFKKYNISGMESSILITTFCKNKELTRQLFEHLDNFVDTEYLNSIEVEFEKEI